MNKDDILFKFSLNNSQKIELDKLIDKAEICSRTHIVKHTNFLDPFLISIGEKVLSKYNDIDFKTAGGSSNAERQVFIMFPHYYHTEDIKEPFKLVVVKDLPNKDNFNHREVLGSVLSLGIKREKIGDIIIHDDSIQIIVMEDIADFISINLKKISNTKVKPFITNTYNLIPREDKFISIKANVKSLRLDSICASGFNESRSRVALDIKKDKVKVNHIPTNSISSGIGEGDLISYRGKGRIIFEKILGKTKKDRFNIQIKKFI